MRERQYSKEEWQKILSRINNILDFSDLKCTYSTEQNQSVNQSRPRNWIDILYIKYKNKTKYKLIDIEDRWQLEGKWTYSNSNRCQKAMG